MTKKDFFDMVIVPLLDGGTEWKVARNFVKDPEIFEDMVAEYLKNKED